jgi:hypothetical protein
MSPARLFPALSAFFALGAAAAYFQFGDATSATADGRAPRPPAARAPDAPKGRETPGHDLRTGEVPTSAARSGASATGNADEAASMQRLRALRTTSPHEALALAEELEARFPNGREAAERSYLAVRSLVDLRRFHEARDRAKSMVERFPGDRYALDVQRHLLVNPLDLPSREEQQRAALNTKRDYTADHSGGS